MKNLKFNQLLVKSDSQKEGNLFQFKTNLILIKADQNSVGKSTLVKLIFWSLGCDPSLDTTWKNLDCKSILCFSIDGTPYRVHRYKDTIHFKKEGESYTKYPKITGDYSTMLNELLGFAVKLPNRSTKVLESPPPAYYFTPYYIDQKKSWSTAWDNFEKLGQYKSWKMNVIKYHIGLLTPEYFNIEELIYENNYEIQDIKLEVSKLDTTTEILSTYVEQNNTTINDNEFIRMTNEIKDTLKNLSDDQEKTLEKITLNQGDKSYFENQIEISKKIIIQLEADYKFSVENIESDVFECPLCGVDHENSVINRTSILVDKEQAESQLNTLESDLIKIEKSINRNSKKVSEIRSEINRINEKYNANTNSEEIDLNNIIETVASNSIRKRITKNKESKIVDESNLKSENRQFKIKQKEINTKEFVEDVNTYFNSTLVDYVDLLNAESVNISNISKPTDYAKIVKEGGAADGNRAILAYYMTIYSMINKYGNEVISPLIIDTPNQNEQSEINFDSIINLILNKLNNSQIILCAMEHEKLKAFEEKAHIIELDNNKILNKKHYIKVCKEFKLD